MVYRHLFQRFVSVFSYDKLVVRGYKQTRTVNRVRMWALRRMRSSGRLASSSYNFLNNFLPPVKGLPGYEPRSAASASAACSAVAWGDANIRRIVCLGFRWFHFRRCHHNFPNLGALNCCLVKGTRTFDLSLSKLLFRRSSSLTGMQICCPCNTRKPTFFFEKLRNEQWIKSETKM